MNCPVFQTEKTFSEFSRQAKLIQLWGIALEQRMGIQVLEAPSMLYVGSYGF